MIVHYFFSWLSGLPQLKSNEKLLKQKCCKTSTIDICLCKKAQIYSLLTLMGLRRCYQQIPAHNHQQRVNLHPKVTTASDWPHWSRSKRCLSLIKARQLFMVYLVKSCLALIRKNPPDEKIVCNSKICYRQELKSNTI